MEKLVINFQARSRIDMWPREDTKGIISSSKNHPINISSETLRVFQGKQKSHVLEMPLNPSIVEPFPVL
jgi:hypothetical protein